MSMDIEFAQIIIPGREDDSVSNFLVWLTEVLDKTGRADAHHGLLGGQYGYGADFENDVFMLHSYCWCERPDCLWCMVWLSNVVDCTEEEEQRHREKQIAQIRLHYGDWMASQHTGAPHFLHKPSKSCVHWYKWIGRSQKYQLNMPLARIMHDCRKSIGVQP